MFERLRQRKKRYGLIRGLLSEKGNQFVSWGYERGVAVLWSLAHGRSTRYVIKVEGSHKIRTCTFSSDGMLLGVGCFTGAFIIYDVSSKNLNNRIVAHHSVKAQPSWSVQELGALFSCQQNSYELVTWDYEDLEGRLSVWDGKTGGLLSQISTGGKVMSCVWSKIGNMFVTITQSQTNLDEYCIQLWGSDSGAMLLKLPQQGPGSGIELDSCVFSAGGARFITYSAQALDHQTMYVWQPPMLTTHPSYPYQLTQLHENENRRESICACTFGNLNLDFIKLAHCDTGGWLYLCNALTGQTLWTCPLAEQGATVNVEQVRFSEDDEFIIATMIQGQQIVVRVISVRSGAIVANYQGGGSIKLPLLLGAKMHQAAFSKKHAVYHSVGISISSNSARVAIAGYRGMDVWNVPKVGTWQNVGYVASRTDFQLENMHDRTPIVCCQIGKSGQIIVFGDTRGVMGLYTHTKGIRVSGTWQYQMIGTINDNVVDNEIDLALMCALSQDEQTIAVCGMHGNVVVWRFDPAASISNKYKEISRLKLKIEETKDGGIHKFENLLFNPSGSELKIFSQRSEEKVTQIHVIKFYAQGWNYTVLKLPAAIEPCREYLSSDLLRGLCRDSRLLDIYDFDFKEAAVDSIELASEPKYRLQVLEHMGSITSCGMSKTDDMIACGTLFGQVVVFTPQGLIGILPDYEQCLIRSNASVVKHWILEENLEVYGVSLLNVPDVTGKNFIVHVVADKNDALLRFIVQWAKDNLQQLCLSSPIKNDNETIPDFDALATAIDARSPACISILLDAMLEGQVIDFNTTANILSNSFTKLVDLYPFLASELLMDTRLLRPLVNMGMVPPSLYIRMTKVKFTGADSINPYAVLDVWQRRIQKAQAVDTDKLLKKEQSLNWEEWFDLDWQELEHKMKTKFTKEIQTQRTLHSTRIGRLRAKSLYSTQTATSAAGISTSGTVLYQSEEFDQSVQIPAEPRVILYKDIAAAGSKSILRSMLQAGEVMNQAFNSPTIRGVIDFKWRTFAQAAVLQQMALYFILLFMFVCYTIIATRENMGTPDFRKTGEGIFVMILGILALIISVVEVGYEVYHIRKRSRKYGQLQLRASQRSLQVSWNIIEFLVHVAIIPMIIFFVIFFQSHFAMFVWVILAVRLIVLEIIQFILLNPLNWITQPWNWLDFISLSLLMIIFGLKVKENENSDWFSYLMSVECVLLWLRVMNYGIAFRGTGPTIQMIYEIMKDIRFFVLLMGLICFGFTNSFFVLYQYSEISRNDDNENFESLGVTFSTMLGTALGALDMTMFTFSSNSLFSTIMATVFLLLVAVVMLNLLIAIMGDSYDRIKENEESRFLKGRAEIIDEIEAVLPHAALGSGSQPYLHALIPEDLEEKDIGSELEWRGRMATIIISVRRMLQKELQSSAAFQKDELLKMSGRLEHIEGIVQQLSEQVKHSQQYKAKAQE
eukprot:TRINITY_DN2318_c0_g1_i2.p1 TRINITY_DN2318_c0_g1~~TRINITY_DN2318_c0_g1_i2.p1  ORF type:complete len:1488 (+),score=161.88 TRINITY_DN2318_c0_g1_i2:119-4465(+)